MARYAALPVSHECPQCANQISFDSALARCVGHPSLDFDTAINKEAEETGAQSRDDFVDSPFTVGGNVHAALAINPPRGARRAMYMLKYRHQDWIENVEIIYTLAN